MQAGAAGTGRVTAGHGQMERTGARANSAQAHSVGRGRSRAQNDVYFGCLVCGCTRSWSRDCFLPLKPQPHKDLSLNNEDESSSPHGETVAKVTTATITFEIALMAEMPINTNTVFIGTA